MSKRATGARTFWNVAAYFRSRAREAWRPVSAGYEARHVVEIDEESWIVCLKVHVVPQDDGTGLGGMRLDLKSSMTLWPSPSKSPTSRRGKRHDSISKILGRHGYIGEWRKSPWGLFGDFWNGRPITPAGLHHETERLAGAVEDLGKLGP